MVLGSILVAFVSAPKHITLVCRLHGTTMRLVLLLVRKLR